LIIQNGKRIYFEDMTEEIYNNAAELRNKTKKHNDD
jgi:hypothetical protein